jgi:hypothetical protein
MTVTSIPVPRMIFRWKKMHKIMKRMTTKLPNFTTAMNSESQQSYLSHLPQYPKSENEAVNVENLVAFLRDPFEFFVAKAILYARARRRLS